jgi:hypothetical protein
MVILYQRDQQFVYARVLPGEKPVLIALNVSNKPVTIEVPVEVIGVAPNEKLTSSLAKGATARSSGSVQIITLPPITGEIFLNPGR